MAEISKYRKAYAERAFERYHSEYCLDPEDHTKCRALVDLVIGTRGVVRTGPMNCRTDNPAEQMLHKPKGEGEDRRSLCGIQLHNPSRYGFLEWEEIRYLSHGPDCICPWWEEWPKCPDCQAELTKMMDAIPGIPRCAKCNHALEDGAKIEVITDDDNLLPPPEAGAGIVFSTDNAEEILSKMILVHVECPT